MKKSLLIIIALLCIPYLKTHAKDDFVAYLGLAAEVGPTNMFFSPFNSDAITYRPMLGGGFGSAVTFEFEYSRFLFHSGFGVNYTFNQNFFHCRKVRSINLNIIDTFLQLHCKLLIFPIKISNLIS